MDGPNKGPLHRVPLIVGDLSNSLTVMTTHGTDGICDDEEEGRRAMIG